MQVTINQGSYRGEEVHNQTFELITDIKSSKKGYQVTVRPNDLIGVGREKIRVTVQNLNDVVYPEGLQTVATQLITSTVPKQEFIPKQKIVETDEEIMARIADRFEILEEMTAAAIEGNIKGMIVVGPPGVGKSYGVIRQLEKANLFDHVKNVEPKYDIIKGRISALGLYIKLFRNKAKNQVLVFDDCDGILMDDLSLNLLKAALDSGKQRKLCWNVDSNALRAEEIPDNFDFNGSVIFITNVQFDNIRSKKLQDHLTALQSRCHYLDLAMNTMRDRMLRIRQIHNTGELFGHMQFDGNEGDIIVEYMEKNKARLREVSLRMAIKIGDLHKVSANWKRLAESTVMLKSF